MKGWYGNSVKHSLASRGIKTEHDKINLQQRKNEILNMVYNSKVGDVLPESIIYQYVQYLHDDEDAFVNGDLGERIEEFNEYKLEKIEISNLEIEFYLDTDKVSEYEKQYYKKMKYPPIVVRKYGDNDYSIIDGSHRVEALKDIWGNKFILAWVGVE